MSQKSQESMRKKLEEWRKTKAQKQLSAKTPLKTFNSQKTHTKQSDIKNSRKSMPYGSSTFRSKENSVIKKNTMKATTTKTLGRTCTAGRKCTKEKSKADGEPKADKLAFSTNLPKDFDMESEKNNKQSRRSTFTKEELVFHESMLIDFEKEAEPDAKKARRNTFTLDSPVPMKKDTSKEMKKPSKRYVTNDKTREKPIEKPVSTKPQTSHIKTFTKKAEEEKSFSVKPPRKNLNQSSKQQHAPTKRTSDVPKTTLVKTSSTYMDKSLSMRARLEMWRKEKGKSSPYPKSKFTKRNHGIPSEEKNKSKKTETVKAPQDQSLPQDLVENSNIEDNTMANIRKMLEECLERIRMGDNCEEIACQLDEIKKNHSEALQQAEYWVCRAEIAGKSGEKNRVFCLYKQAVAFNAKPESLIKNNMAALEMEKEAMQGTVQEECQEDLSMPLLDIQSQDQDSKASNKQTASKESCMLEYMSPSSTIRYSVTKATPRPSRLKTCERPTVTPVRRSVRLERRSIYYPVMLQDHNLTVKHLDEIPLDMKEEMTFKPNFSVTSELNDAWKEIMES